MLGSSKIYSIQAKIQKLPSLSASGISLCNEKCISLPYSKLTKIDLKQNNLLGLPGLKSFSSPNNR